MKKLLLITIALVSFSCSQNNKKDKEKSTVNTTSEKKEQQNTLKKAPLNLDKLMDSDTFWSIIATSKSNSSGNYQKQQTELKKALVKLTANEILAFDNTFRTLRGEVYNWDFWAAAYIINGGCSDDCFSDFRGWLIGQGKEIFEKSREDIESLAELTATNDGDWEGLSYVPFEAYEQKTGKEMPSGIQENFKISGEEWSEDGDDLKKRFPKLWAKFVMR